MRQSKHPLVDRDLIAIAEHVLQVTQGDFTADKRRLDEVDALLVDVAANPGAGMRLGGPLEGWLVCHGGKDHRLTIAFRPDFDNNVIKVALVTFGGQDWMSQGKARRAETF